MATRTVQPQFLMMDPKKLVRIDNPRKDRDPKADAQLQASIAAIGVVVPVVARWEDGKPVLIAGARRTEMAIAAGCASIPVFFPQDLEGDAVRPVQVIENVHRADMTLRDLSSAVWDIYNEAAMGSAAMTSEILGMSKSWVSKMLVVGSPDCATSTVARKLIAADKINDLEIAYLLSRLEKLNKEEAEAAGKAIEEHTRATLRNLIKDLEDGAPPPSEKTASNGDGGEAAGQEDEPSGDAKTVRLTLNIELAELVRNVLRQATVPPAQLQRLHDALEAVTASIEAAYSAAV